MTESTAIADVALPAGAVDWLFRTKPWSLQTKRSLTSMSSWNLQKEWTSDSMMVAYVHRGLSPHESAMLGRKFLTDDLAVTVR